MNNGGNSILRQAIALQVISPDFVDIFDMNDVWLSAHSFGKVVRQSF